MACQFAVAATALVVLQRQRTRCRNTTNSSSTKEAQDRLPSAAATPVPTEQARRFWDGHFSETSEAHEDWIATYAELKPVFELDPQAAVLVVGCGASEISVALYEDGCHGITNVDISPVVIEKMKERNKTRQMMRWDVGDCLCLSKQYDASSFDLVFDKACCDTFFHRNRSKASKKMVSRYLDQVYTVLKSTGRLILVTPRQKMPELHSRKWQVTRRTLKRSEGSVMNKRHGESETKPQCYVYVCQKGGVKESWVHEHRESTAAKAAARSAWHERSIAQYSTLQERHQQEGYHSVSMADVKRRVMHDGVGADMGADSLLLAMEGLVRFKSKFGRNRFAYWLSTPNETNSDHALAKEECVQVFVNAARLKPIDGEQQEQEEQEEQEKKQQILAGLLHVGDCVVVQGALSIATKDSSKARCVVAHRMWLSCPRVQTGPRTRQ
jgi:SAM-dependent methyltransferase